MPLRPSYADRVFTTSVVSYPGVAHIGEDRDFSPVIAKALELGGYPEDTLIPGMNGGSVVATGFAHHAVLSHAEEIVQAVHEGAIRHFFLIGGCDGTRPSRRYYTDFAKLTPPDTVILTLACGKFRLNDLPPVSYTHLDVYKRQLDSTVCTQQQGEIKAEGYDGSVQHHQQSPAGQYLQHISFLFLHRISSFSSGPASEDVSFRFLFQGPITP